LSGLDCELESELELVLELQLGLSLWISSEDIENELLGVRLV